MIVDFQGKQYPVKFWRGEKVTGDYLTVDTETLNINEETREVPDLVLLQVFDGHTCWLADWENGHGLVAQFKDQPLVMHNSPFDVAVLGKAFRWSCIDHVENEQLWDTGILFRLRDLYYRGAVGQWALDYICQVLLKETISKDSSVRMGWTRDNRCWEWGEDRLVYGATDVVATRACFDAMGWILREKNALTHNIQLKGEIALDRITRRGIGFDLGAKDAFLAGLDAEIEHILANLAEFGWVPGKKGVQQIAQKLLSQIEEEEKVKLPRTPKPRKDGTRLISTKREDLEEFTDHAFVRNFLDYQERSKLRTFVEKVDKPRVHPRYTGILRTGRTSCTSPNIQQLPRRPGVRECFVPKEGHVFVIADFSMLELITLAQTTYTMYGFSQMREVINQGLDVHKWFAAQMYGIEESQVTKEQRQSAKACFDPETELLTPEGWLPIDKVRSLGVRVAQWYPDGKINFTHPLEWVDRDEGEVLDIDCGILTSVTPDHRVPTLTRSGGLLVRPAAQVSREISHCSVVQAGKCSYRPTISEAATRLAVAVQADGTFRLPGRKGRVSFKKKHKADRFRDLLAAAGVHATESFNNDRWHFHFEKAVIALDADKRFLNPMAYDPDAFLDEICKWDGDDCDDKNYVLYRTTSQHAVDCVQTIACLNGQRTRVVEVSCGYKGTPGYMVMIHKSPVHRISRKTTVSRRTGRSLCCAVPSTFLVTRYHNSVSISGNCNFGFPGGLGVRKFVGFANKTYKCRFDAEGAAVLKDTWIRSFPEMEIWLKDTIQEQFDWSDCPMDEEIREAITTRILRGQYHSNFGKLYPKSYFTWVHEHVICAADPWFRVNAYDPEKHFMRVWSEDTWTVTGRKRARASYNASRNTKFQGLGGDALKCALWEAEKQGLKVVAEIHDELIVEAPVEKAEEQLRLLEKCMLEGLRQVCPDVKGGVEGSIKERWSK